MATSDEIKEWLMNKQAGVLRMQSRQKIVHTKMADLIESDPNIIEKAKERVKNRLAKSGQATCEIYLEWQQILATWSNDKIASLLRSDDDKHDQLKACAPFDFQGIKQ